MNQLPVEYERKRVKEGWMGKPKGMLQILFERGFIETVGRRVEDVVRSFSLNGKKDNYGQIIAGTSLKEMINDLPDFKTEITLLQLRAIQLNVQIQCSPKYHPEIAGEGIEYAWGISKNTYRKYSVIDKKTREGFRRLVKNSINPDTVLTKERMRLFAKRQRRYILAYLGMEHAKDSIVIPHVNQELHLPEMSCQLVKRLVCIFKHPHKSHRNILDQETEFLDSVVQWMKGICAKPVGPV